MLAHMQQNTHANVLSKSSVQLTSAGVSMHHTAARVSAETTGSYDECSVQTTPLPCHGEITTT